MTSIVIYTSPLTMKLSHYSIIPIVMAVFLPIHAGASESEFRDSDPLLAGYENKELSEALSGDQQARKMEPLSLPPSEDFDFARSRMKLRQLAESHDPKALYDYALLVYSGKGGIQDLERARYLFKMAADGGHCEARVQLGLMQKDGVGGEQDLKGALTNFEIAASEDSKEGEKWLSFLQNQDDGYRRAARARRRAKLNKRARERREQGGGTEILPLRGAQRGFSREHCEGVVDRAVLSMEDINSIRSAFRGGELPWWCSCLPSDCSEKCVVQ